MDSDAPAARSIISRWRIPAGEVQVNQALALVCQHAPVAHGFLDAVLEVQSRSVGYGKQATRLRESLPDDVRCRTEIERHFGSSL